MIGRITKALLLAFFLFSLAFADGDNNNCFNTQQTLNLEDVMYIEEKIDYQGDIDWFKGTGSSEFTLHGVMVPPNNRDYDVAIYDYCGGPIVRDCVHGSGETEDENCVTPTNAIQEDFYIKVYGYGGGYEPNAPYYITAGVKATCDLISQNGWPLQNYFYQNQSLDSDGFYYKNTNSFSIGYYYVSNLFRPTGSIIDKAINNQIQLLSPGEEETFFDSFYPPAWNGNLWPEIGTYKHKTFLLAYCGLGYVDVTSKNSFSSPVVVESQQPKPNLQVSQIYTFPGNPTGGQPAKIYVTTSETNNVNAPISCTRLLDDGNTLASFCQSIPAGLSTTNFIQTNLPIGNHNLTAIADYYNDIQESNEGDNFLSIQKYWKEPLPMYGTIENLHQRYYTTEQIPFDIYLYNNSGGLDGAYVTAFNPFTQEQEQQTTSQQGRYWFNWTASSTGLKQFTLNSFKYGHIPRSDSAQVIITPETARLYATVFNSSNKPVWGAKFKIDGEERGAAGRNGQIVIPSERGNRQVEVRCPNNNLCVNENVYLQENTEKRYTCNCPDSTTNIVLNLTAFSDALPPDDEHISANGLPISNAMISVGEEFDALYNTTDAGGMLAVRNIPYGYHDFRFHYCLEWNNQTNKCKDGAVWQSYSRTNIQPGTKYVNFALNVDAMQPQGNNSGFQSYSYKNGMWVMTAGKYDKQILPFLAAIAIQLAISYLNEQDLIRKGCFVNGELDYSRSDCVAQGWGVEAAMMLGPGGIPLASLKAIAKKGPITIGKEALKKDWPQYIGNGLERTRFWADDAVFEVRSQVYRSTAKLFRHELKDMFKSLLQKMPRNVLKVQGNTVKIGEKTITRTDFGNINRLSQARDRLKELNDRGLIEGVQKSVRGTVQKAYIIESRHVVHNGDNYLVEVGDYLGNVRVYQARFENGQWIRYGNTINEFDNIMLLRQNTDEGVKFSLVRGESATLLDINKAKQITNKELGLDIIKKQFSDLGMQVEETVNVVIHSKPGQHGLLNNEPYIIEEPTSEALSLLHNKGWAVVNRGIDETIEGGTSLFKESLEIIGFR